jgi:multidrug resistance protein
MNLYANLAAITLAPAAPLLATEFHITNNTLTSLTVSIHILGFVFGPFFVPPLSEIYGRLWLYHACNVAYMGFTVGCALSTNTGMLLVCRFLCGCVASGPMAIGGGSIADLYETEERGKAIAMMNLGQLLGPVIGPVIGGFVAQRLGWRWIFWLVLVIVSCPTLYIASV